MKNKGKLIIYNIEIIAFSIVSTRIVEMLSDTFGRTTKYLLETIAFITVVLGILVNRWIILGGIKLLYNYIFKQSSEESNTFDISKGIDSKLKDREKYKTNIRVKQSDNSDRKSISEQEKPLVKNKNICSEYKTRIKHNKNKRTFGDNIRYILNQMDRFVSKLEILTEMIEMRFRKGEITYARLYMGLEEIEDIFYKNILRIIHKLEAFDESEYFHTMNEKSNVSRRIIEQKNRIYREYKLIIKGLIETNEEILIKMDELILEFSGLSMQEDKKGGKLVATQKIDELIGMTRLYK